MPDNRDRSGPWPRRPRARRALLYAVATAFVLAAALSGLPSAHPAVPALATALPRPHSTASPTGPPPGAAATGPGIFPSDTLSHAGWSVQDRVISAGGRSRTYLVARSLAPGSGELPVLVVLHGRTMSPAAMARVSGFLPILGRAIVVYPAGMGLSWNAGTCCGPAMAGGVDDVSFIKAVVHEVLVTEPGTSPRSVFLTGYSNGGRMAYRMACVAPGLFAGVAAVEAVPAATCPATRLHIPLLTVVSAVDPLLRIGPGSPPKVVDGHLQPDVIGVVAQWRRTDGCSPTTNVTVTGELTTTLWPDCTAHAQVGFSLYQYGRHAWPTGRPGTPSAQAQILAFFNRLRPTVFQPVGS